MSTIGKSIDRENTLVPPAQGILEGCGVSFWNNESVLELIVMMMHKSVTIRKAIESYCFKKLNHVLCELYLNKAVKRRDSEWKQKAIL